MDTQEHVDSCINACDFLSLFHTANWEERVYLLLSVSMPYSLFALISVIQYSCYLSHGLYTICFFSTFGYETITYLSAFCFSE